MATHLTLNNAKQNKADEFYTQLSDIVKELKHYKDKFRDKIIYLPCDNPEFSQFYYYFFNKFKILGLKKLITSFYSPKSLFGNGGGIESYVTIIDKDKQVSKIKLKGNGDFRSKELIPYWKEADIIVTNPPFSLFREFVDTIYFYKKKFLVVCHQASFGYSNIFDKIKNNEIHLGYGFSSNVGYFINTKYKDYAIAGNHKDGLIRVSGVAWLTNLLKISVKKLKLVKKYNPYEYPKYDNYNAINVDKSKNIPYDYSDLIGVPVTFLYKYNPDQFNIIDNLQTPILNNSSMYRRIIIKLNNNVIN